MAAILHIKQSLVESCYSSNLHLDIFQVISEFRVKVDLRPFFKKPFQILIHIINAFFSFFLQATEISGAMTLSGTECSPFLSL